MTDEAHLTPAALHDALRLLGALLPLEGEIGPTSTAMTALVDDLLARAPQRVAVSAMATLALLLLRRSAAVSGFSPQQEYRALANELRYRPADEQGNGSASA